MSTIAEKLTTIAENEQKVYDKGNSDGYAEKVTARLYDAESQSWKSLDGVSYTADMQNALNILGVT